MAGSVQDDDDDLDEHHEINVTPFIDVMLVLLIIFMVAAPLSTVDVPVELPASTANAKPRPDKPVFVTIKTDLSVSVGETETSERDLVGALDRVIANKANDRVFLRADKAVSYGDLMRIMNTLREGGYLKVALVGIEDAASLPAQSQGVAPVAP